MWILNQQLWGHDCNTLLTIRILSEQFKKLCEIRDVMNSALHRHCICRTQRLDGKQQQTVSITISKTAHALNNKK
jgi:hypothetical protein